MKVTEMRSAELVQEFADIREEVVRAAFADRMFTGAESRRLYAVVDELRRRSLLD